MVGAVKLLPFDLAFGGNLVYMSEALRGMVFMGKCELAVSVLCTAAVLYIDGTLSGTCAEVL